MNKKWSSDKVKRAQQWLIEQWPDLFTPGPDLKPLSLKIHKEILQHRLENADISSRVLQEALKRHTTSFGYLYGMTKSSHRHNLDGEPVEPITASNRAWAQKTLRLLQKISQKTNRSKAMVRKANKQLPLRSVRPKYATPLTPTVRTAEIRYKRPKRRVIPATASSSAPTALAS